MNVLPSLKRYFNKEGQELGLKIINIINRKWQMWNCQKQLIIVSKSARNVSIKLAQKDRLLKYNTQYSI